MSSYRYQKKDRVTKVNSYGYYYAIYYIDGTRYAETTRTKDVVRAVEKLKEFRARRESGIVPFRRSQALRLPELIEEFLDWYEHTKKRSPLSVRRHRIASKALLNYFGRAKVRSITTTRIEEYVGARKAASNTIRNEINLLSGILGYAAKPARGYIRTNPVPHIENRPPTRRVKPPFALTAEEVEKILGALREPHHRLFFLLLLNTGMRLTEATQLEWSDIDFDVGNGVGEIIVKKAKYYKWRRIPLFKRLRIELEATQRKIGRVIKHHRKTGYEKGMYTVFRRVIEETGVRPFSHHTLRHTFVSRCYKTGISDLQIASWTGHSPEVLRRLYLHLIQVDFQEIQKLEKFSQSDEPGFK